VLLWTPSVLRYSALAIRMLPDVLPQNDMCQVPLHAISSPLTSPRSCLTHSKGSAPTS
jgi:hypothetical protein